eukprot:TRINITY_DN43928_c0_g1_i1.p1 TRINITY_DN43928_c0_g1~~TRINITY_DN43928_c0_g1_i1.p1  ORF type:complete len:136 (+),score=9.38 TRINITY_DN43928_c0_g1_i1:214-621(+)
MFYFSYIMDKICYYQSMALSPKCVVRKKAPLLAERDQPEIDQIYWNNKTCEKCNSFWKPQRAHHCSTCNKCISGMDHHCPWTFCCIGNRNHKSFLLFTFYLLIGALIYFYYSIYFMAHEYSQNTLFSHNLFFYLL